MCAIFGVFHAEKAAELCVIGLHANQHRAIDYAGIVSSDGYNLYRERGAGLARQAFTGDMLRALHGLDALGHIRYPTVSDEAGRDNIQPIVGMYHGKPIALAHNGNITNADDLRRELRIRFATSLDTECIVRLLDRESSGDIARDMAAIAPRLKGSYALGILLPDRILAVRDPSGNRPLSIGVKGDSYFISSETCAFPNVGARLIHDLAPGEIVMIQKDGMSIRRMHHTAVRRQCRFEAIYYSHPSSTVFGERIAEFRARLGEALEDSAPTLGADVVTPIPDSATFIALGYGSSGRSGKYFPLITRNHYVGRTFIAATQAKRDEEVSQKFNFAADLIAGQRIVVVDDSIVRGTTLPKIVAQLRFLGAKEVHVRIGSPPITDSCRYGINTPLRSRLIASHKSPDEIRAWVGSDSLEYLPLPVLRSLSAEPDAFCYACMTGNYW